MEHYIYIFCIFIKFLLTQNNNIHMKLTEEVKEVYEAPAMLVVEAKTEGIVCASGGLNNYDRQSGEDW